MPYRTEQTTIAALEATRGEVRAELAETRRHIHALFRLAQRQEALVIELADVDAQLSRAHYARRAASPGGRPDADFLDGRGGGAWLRRAAFGALGAVALAGAGMAGFAMAPRPAPESRCEPPPATTAAEIAVLQPPAPEPAAAPPVAGREPTLPRPTGCGKFLKRCKPVDLGF